LTLCVEELFHKPIKMMITPIIFRTLQSTALAAANRKFEYKIYDAAPGGHHFNRLDTRLARDSRAEVYQFLRRYLRP